MYTCFNLRGGWFRPCRVICAQERADWFRCSNMGTEGIAKRVPTACSRKETTRFSWTARFFLVNRLYRQVDTWRIEMRITQCWGRLCHLVWCGRKMWCLLYNWQSHRHWQRAMFGDTLYWQRIRWIRTSRLDVSVWAQRNGDKCYPGWITVRLLW